MRILQVHKYFSGTRGGGSVSAFFQTKRILENRGHTVQIFSMQDDENYRSKYSKYFAEHFDINKAENLWEKMKFAYKSIYNREAQKKLEALIKKEKPEVAHVHNIYHYLTPAILHTLKKHKTPVVFKLSDYKAICPNYKLFVNGEICEKCKGGKYYQCFLNKCLKNSRGVSLVAMLEAYVHKFIKSYQKVDYFLAPSEFMKNKCAEFGIPREKIKILRNALDVEEFDSPGNFEEENHFLYFGRISEEKGLEDLLQAVSVLKEQNKLRGNKLKIAGKGPREEYLKNLTRELRLEEEIEFVGFKQGEELKEVIRKSKFTILPSVWYDNSPMAVSETQLLEKPVIVSDRGGTKEMIKDKETGFVFKAEDIQDLSKKIEDMINLDKEDRKKMGEKGRENIKNLNSQEKYYKKLMSIYEDLSEKNI
ncbi:MAG: glycosyltransferase family 4 protein [Candidatus Moraniibacteriota bacterium]